MDPGLHGPDLGRRDRRDLLICEAFDVPQEKGGALVGRYGRKGLLDDTQRFATGGQIRELGPRRNWFSPADRIVTLRRRVERKLGIPLPRSEPIERAVGHDTKDPRAKRSSLEGRHRFPGGQERVLHAVFGVIMAKHPSRMAIQRPLDLESKLLESAGVASPCPIEEHIAHSAEFRPHQRTFACPQLLR